MTRLWTLVFLLVAANACGKDDRDPPAGSDDGPTSVQPASTQPAGTVAGNLPVVLPGASVVAAKATGKKLLFVVANRDFAFQEYRGARGAVEAAGHEVVVAAGSSHVATPAAGGGQVGSGSVVPRFALADVDVNDFDALVLIGGPGTTTYLYGFPGVAAAENYRQQEEPAAQLNALMVGFTRQFKPVAAIGQAVAVLAWSRDAEGRSLLSGKTVVASEQGSPAVTVEGRVYGDGELSMRWHVEKNGATMRAESSIGNPTTSADDVERQGLLVTGQNGASALEFGRVVGQVLKE